MPQIFKIVAFIDIPSDPSEHPITTFLIVNVIPFIGISLSLDLLPNSLTMPQPILEVAFEIRTIRPGVFAITAWLSINIPTRILIPVGEILHAFPMLQTGLKLALVPIPIDPGVDPIAIGHAKLPLSDIGIPPAPRPHAGPMLLPIDPHALIDLPIGPPESPEPLGLAIHKIACIVGPIGKPLKPKPMLDIALPATLIHPATMIDHDALALPLLVYNLSEVVTSSVAL